MKKLFPIALALMILLTACGTKSAESSTPYYKVVNGCFNCTPQEFTDNVNSLIAENPDVPQIPDIGIYRSSAVKIDGEHLSLTMFEDEGLTNVYLYWYSGDNNLNVIKYAGIYTSLLLKLLVPDPDSIGTDISTVIDAGYGSFNETQGNVDIRFERSGTGANRLYIIPKDGTSD